MMERVSLGFFFTYGDVCSQQGMIHVEAPCVQTVNSLNFSKGEQLLSNSPRGDVLRST